ncbi:alpha/beta hydrolase fold protein [Nitratireductor indicus C115]|uniref:Alpha/beta hydrolase fold protein n=1 Tax=Nitratireductor indicus C115 TaxID=1231190 RepID=K2PAR8_9HYPH|nr:alpha/beta hydrolase fold protein [Nitratireductor indicus C115]
MPLFRGYETPRFQSSDTPRNAQLSVFTADMIALMDVFDIDKAIVADFDWGARTVNIMASLWPERCQAMVSVSGYLIGSKKGNGKPLPPAPNICGDTNTTLPQSGVVLAAKNIPTRSRS